MSEKNAQPLDADEIPLGSDLDQWQVALQWAELKKRAGARSDRERIRLRDLEQIAISAVLRKARSILGAVVRPEYFATEELTRFSTVPSAAELDIEESFEHGFERLFFEVRKYRDEPLVLVMDTSLSMTGEKLAWAAVALSVVALQFEQSRLAIVTFQNDAQVLKDWNEELSIERVLERFLDLEVEGYTHLEAGLEKALEMVRAMMGKSRGRRVPALLLSDGKYTAGRDPRVIAPLFPRLVVLKIGQDTTSLELCRDLALRGHGKMLEVPDEMALPRGVASAAREILRLS